MTKQHQRSEHTVHIDYVEYVENKKASEILVVVFFLMLSIFVDAET